MINHYSRVLPLVALLSLGACSSTKKITKKKPTTHISKEIGINDVYSYRQDDFYYLPEEQPAQPVHVKEIKQVSKDTTLEKQGSDILPFDYDEDELLIEEQPAQDDAKEIGMQEMGKEVDIEEPATLDIQPIEQK
jgi:hypothetical protein